MLILGLEGRVLGFEFRVLGFFRFLYKLVGVCVGLNSVF